MDRCFFPSCAWPGDGEGDGSFPSDVHQGSSLLPHPVDAVVGSPVSMFHGPSPSSSTSSSAVLRGSAGEKAAAASRLRSLAERRRRERINGHLSTLRRMIPDANKMDKASLLASVIHEIKVLKGKVVDVSKGFILPAEVNHVTVECEQSSEQANKHTSLIKASICCDDRPDLFSDLIEAFHGLKLKALRADIVSLGGRVQNFFVLCRASNDETMCLSSLMETIKQVLGRVASIDEEESTYLLSKRRR